MPLLQTSQSSLGPGPSFSISSTVPPGLSAKVTPNPAPCPPRPPRHPGLRPKPESPTVLTPTRKEGEGKAHACTGPQVYVHWQPTSGERLRNELRFRNPVSQQGAWESRGQPHYLRAWIWFL